MLSNYFPIWDNQICYSICKIQKSQVQILIDYENKNQDGNLLPIFLLFLREKFIAEYSFIIRKTVGQM